MPGSMEGKDHLLPQAVYYRAQRDLPRHISYLMLESNTNLQPLRSEEISTLTLGYKPKISCIFGTNIKSEKYSFFDDTLVPEF